MREGKVLLTTELEIKGLPWIESPKLKAGILDIHLRQIIKYTREV